MATSNLNLGKASGGVLNIQPADGTTATSIVLPSTGTVVSDATLKTINGNSLVGSGDISLINLSSVTAYHLLQGNLAVSNYTTTQGFNTTLYTGNGGTQSINTGIDMSTQWGNDASETFGGLVWLKSRSGAQNNRLIDTVRGSNVLFSNTTQAQLGISGLFSNTNTGFSISDSHSDWNASAATYASWNFQTTHRVTGTTNHGKAYTCHYNPFTGFTMVQYTGSGIVGHEIPHMLGRKIGFYFAKATDIASDFEAQYRENYRLILNTTSSEINNTPYSPTSITDKNIIVGTGFPNNANTYIMYGWANSYFDKSNKLIGNYEIGIYQGTGVAGNKIQTRGKPAWVMTKRLDSTGNWRIFDNQRPYTLFPSVSTAETNESNKPTFSIDGFIVNTTDIENNASGGQYLYMVAYDTNSNGGGTYYPLASDTANVQVNNALIPIAQGIDSNGAKNTILSKNETFSGVTYTQGKNYPYYDALGNRGVSVHKPRYLESELVRTYAGESPDYFNVKENKWYSTNSGSELVTNGTFSSGTTTGWIAGSVWNGGTATISIVNNTLKVQNNTTHNGAVQQAISTVIGKKYTFKASINASNSWAVQIGDISFGSTSFGAVKEVIFTANSTTTYITIVIFDGTSGNYILIDNISVFETTITPTTEITNGRNYLNHIVYADNDGGVLYVEELPKIEYKDIVKANEFKGKNACTAWVNFDGTTTPPTIRDSYNVSAVIRTSTGTYDIYFKEPMDNVNYGVFGTSNNSGSAFGSYVISGAPTATANDGKYLNKVTIGVLNTNAMYNPISASVEIKGGKN